jgi:hypothetical protein
MLKAIPDPEKTTTETGIEAQLQEAFALTIATIDPSLDNSHCAIQLMEELQADYIPLDASDVEWNYLDADDDADRGLF